MTSRGSAHPALIALGAVGAAGVAATVLLSRWFVKRRGTAMGIAIAGVAMGSVVYPPIVQFLIDHHPWREALRLVALVLLVGTLPAALDATADIRKRRPAG